MRVKPLIIVILCYHIGEICNWTRGTSKYDRQLGEVNDVVLLIVFDKFM